MLRVRAAALLLCAAGVTGLTGACSQSNDYYSHDPYRDGRTIDRGLAAAEQGVARLLGSGDTDRVLRERTAPPWRDRMEQFLRKYGGHPVRVVGMTAGDDATADEVLAVSCRGGAQRVTLTWAWFDGSWRAWPDYALTAAGKAVEYPGCR